MDLKKQIRLFFQQTLLITKVTFKNLAISPLFFFCVGLSCIFLSYVFPRELFRFASSYIPVFQQGASQTRNIHYDVFVSHISYINLLFLFCIPALAMKLLADEKKMKTFGLLMTAPITSLQIVLGKYFGLLLSIVLFLLATLMYPLSTAFFTDIPVGPLVSAYIGLTLLSFVYAAVGLFASALTSSAVISLILGIILNISLWFISQGQDFSNNPIFLSVMEYLSLSQHLTNFIKGSLVVSSFVFFFSCMLFFIFLTYKVVEFSRWRS